jgi:signal transduction histidine kinase/DNA-binding NarL/FixJ family response regulator
MKKTIFLLIFIVSITSQSFADKQGREKIDSLLTILKTAKEDTSKVNMLNNVCAEKTNAREFSKARDYASEALALAEKIHFKKGIANSYYKIGITYELSSDYTMALPYYQKALAINEQLSNNTGMAANLNGIGNAYRMSAEYLKALPFYQKALTINEKSGNKPWSAINLLNIGVDYYNLSDYPKALEYWQKALTIFEQLGNKGGIALILGNTGDVYYYLSDYPSALEYWQKALTIFEQLGNKGGIADNLGNIGNVYNDLADYPKALEFYQKSMDMFGQLGDTGGIAFNLDNIGVVYNHSSDYLKALECLQKALAINEQFGDKERITRNLENIGISYNYLTDYPRALENFKKALKIAEEIGEREMISDLYNNIGEIYEKQGNMNEALKFVQKGLSIALEIGAKEHIKSAYGNLAKIDSAMNNFRDAFVNRTLYMQYSDSIFNIDKEKKVTTLQMKYEFAKVQDSVKAEQIKKDVMTQKKLQKEKLVRNGFICGFALVLIFSLIVYRQRNRIKKGNIELQLAKERAEQSEKFKEQFLANMSHEIRTPMNAVMGMTSLVLDSPLNEKQRFYLEGIRKSGETLLYIINDILDLSKIEAGKMEIENIDFSVSEVLEQVKQTLQHKAEEKGLQLIVDRDAKVPDVLMGDPVRLNQILMNLAGNAIKFTEIGSVTISVSNRQLAVGSLVGLKFSITDTGIGIPEDKLQTVFESFTQAKPSVTRRYGGTGLGLTISRQFVELMDGKISVESKEGSGTTFSFEISFPVGSPERLKEQRSAEQIDGSILNGLKILLADDNEYNRIVTHDTLISKASVEITEVTNGKEAADLLSQQDFDVVLMDVKMPIMDGYEATRYIRERFSSPKNQTPVIALTASVIRSDLDKCRDAGMNDYIPKPFRASQLISVIAKVMQREIRFSEKSIPGTRNKTENDKVTDLGYLKEFCEGDKERMQKYIGMFLASAPYIIDYINIALNNKDYTEIAGQMHGNKTKLIMMGMNKAKDLAAEIEMQCKEGINSDILEEKILTFIKQIEKAVTELKVI